MTPTLPPVEALEGLGREDLARFVVHVGSLLTAATIRLATLPAPTPPAARAYTPGAADWLTPAQVEAWLGCSARTVRRRRTDGTWRKGTHWFQQAGARVRFSRAALEAWLRTVGEDAPAQGLAFGPDIPEGRRRRRLTLLRNECTPSGDGSEAQAADGAASGVSGARAVDGAPRA